MRRRHLIAGLVLALAATGPGDAAPVDDIVAGLRAEGYEVREVTRTWLGRIRVEAINDRYQREIVFDRVTGEILRDYLSKRRPERPASDGQGATGSGASGSSGGGANDDGGGDDHGSDDAGSDDAGDDDGGDDHGGTSSGHGSGGSSGTGGGSGSSASHGGSGSSGGSGGGDDDDDDD